jgi:hypothetical protein
LITVLFFHELQQHMPVTQAAILIDDTHHPKAVLSRLGLRFRYVATEIGMLSNVCLEKLRRRKYLFSHTFSCVQPTTAER